MAGDPNPSLERLKGHTRYEGISEDSTEVKLLWEILTEFCPGDRSKFMLFVWGRSRLPVGDVWEPNVFKVSTRRPRRAAPRDPPR